jgi:hypothetical protein
MKLSLERLARRIAELGGGGGGSSMPVLTLTGNPLLTPTAGALSQFGTFGGSLYVHLTAATDTNWLNLSTVSGWPVLTLSLDPTAHITHGEVGQFGTFGGDLFLKLSAGDSTDWLNLSLARDLLSVVPLSADPTVTSTAGLQRQFGDFNGNLFLHLTPDADNCWLNLSALPPHYAVTFANLTDGSWYVHLIFTDATTLTVTKTAAQIRAAAIAQSMGALSFGYVEFPASDLAAVAGKQLDGATVTTIGTTLPFKSINGLNRFASKNHGVVVRNGGAEDVICTDLVALDGVATNTQAAPPYAFDTGDYLAVQFELSGNSRF